MTNIHQADDSLKAFTDRIGTTALLSIDSLVVEVTILDAKMAYGRRRYVVTPTHGSGTQTVEADRIVFGGAQ